MNVPRLNPLEVVVDVCDRFGLNVPVDRENVCESEGDIALPSVLVPVGVVRERVPARRPAVERVEEAASVPLERLLEEARLLEVAAPVGETLRVEVMSERRRVPVERDAVEVERDRLDAAGEILEEEPEAIGEVDGA